MNKKILLVGGGGHCRSVLDTLLQLNEYSEIRIIDVKENMGKIIYGVPVIGSDDDLPRLFNRGYQYAFVTVGSIGDSTLRIKLFDLLCKIGFDIPNIIDSSAVVSSQVEMETGIFIGKNAVINAGSSIHKGAIINTSSVIEHDCVVQEFSHIAPGAVLCGDVKVGENTHIGAKSVIKQQTKIGSNTIIGMGSTVLTDIGSEVIAYGTPCKEVQPK